MNIEITNNSDRFREALKDVLPMILNDWGTVAEGYAKLKCPVDTGRLKNSITFATTDNLGRENYTDDKGNAYSGGSARSTPDDEASVYIGTNVEYGPYIEYGTSRRAPRPFLNPAITEHVQDYRDIMDHYLENG